MQLKGEIASALNAYKKATNLNSRYAEAHRNFSILKSFTKTDPQVQAMTELYQNRNISKSDRCHICFALGKAYEDMGKVDRSFSFFCEGNNLRKELLDYDISEDVVHFQKIKKVCMRLPRSSIDLRLENDGITPIFIVGMPRSGTTLIEQIISSHSEVEGAGELNYVERFGSEIIKQSSAPQPEAIDQFRKHYTSALQKKSNGKIFVTDKMPQNFRYLGLILNAFPKAKIVHIKRSPEATCWSNFQQYFPAEGLRFCYNLSDLVGYYNLYQDIMNFWNANHKGAIYNVSYEGITNNPKAEIRRLIEYVGLGWEAACLSPEKNRRIIRTASHQQIRSKIYKGSSEKWRKFETFIADEFKSLEP